MAQCLGHHGNPYWTIDREWLYRHLSAEELLTHVVDLWCRSANAQFPRVAVLGALLRLLGPMSESARMQLVASLRQSQFSNWRQLVDTPAIELQRLSRGQSSDEINAIESYLLEVIDDAAASWESDGIGALPIQTVLKELTDSLFDFGVFSAHPSRNLSDVGARVQLMRKRRKELLKYIRGQRTSPSPAATASPAAHESGE